MSVLSPDVLRAIFQILYSQLCDHNDEAEGDESSQEEPGIEYPALQFSYVTRVHRVFAKLRRVCRAWRAVADPFLFRQFSFSISPSPYHRSGFERAYGMMIKEGGPESRPWTVR